MPPRVKVTDDAVTRVKKTGQMERPEMPVHEEVALKGKYRPSGSPHNPSVDDRPTRETAESDAKMIRCMKIKSHEECVAQLSKRKAKTNGRSY
jgi:hypothetical protein